MRLFLRSDIAKIQLMNSCLLLVVGVTLLFDWQLTIRLAALVATVWLTMLLIAPRLLKSIASPFWQGQLLQIARNSKWVGIWTAVWTLLFLGLMIPSWSLSPITVGLVLLVSLILLLLLALSNVWSYAHVRWWKHLNMLIWMVPPLLMYLVLLTIRDWFIIVLLIACIVVGLASIFQRPQDYFALYRAKLLGLALGLGLAALLLS